MRSLRGGSVVSPDNYRLRLTWLVVIVLLVAGLVLDKVLITLAAALVALPAVVITVGRWLEARRALRAGTIRRPRREDRP